MYGSRAWRGCGWNGTVQRVRAVEDAPFCSGEDVLPTLALTLHLGLMNWHWNAECCVSTGGVQQFTVCCFLRFPVLEFVQAVRNHAHFDALVRVRRTHTSLCAAQQRFQYNSRRIHIQMLPLAMPCCRALPNTPVASTSNRPCTSQVVSFPAPTKRSHMLCRASATGAPPAMNTVGDIMTTDVLTVTPDTTIDDALELLVSNRITGLPVVNNTGIVVGVVSDWDMLPLGTHPTIWIL